jgi:Uncharacterized conserved protein (DUF2278)/Lamin Tail Domain
MLYLADEAFAHPLVQELPGLPDGFSPLPSAAGGLALDFIRANLFDRTLLRPVPATAPGPDNDLADKLDHFVERAEADPAARVYAFGQRWGPEPEPGEQRVRIVAALVNPRGPAPEAETVTLLNAGPDDLDLAGWSIVDQAKRRLVLDGGVLPAGEAVRVALGPTVQLGNRGGLVTLLDPDGLKVDGVAYTKSQAAAEGWSLVFR